MAMIPPEELRKIENCPDSYFLRESESYLREAVEDKWIARRTQDFPRYLGELQGEAIELGLRDRMHVFKYMMAALLSDSDDPDEVADFEELRGDLRGKAYETGQVLDVFLEYFLDEAKDKVD